MSHGPLCLLTTVGDCSLISPLYGGCLLFSPPPLCIASFEGWICILDDLGYIIECMLLDFVTGFFSNGKTCLL